MDQDEARRAGQTWGQGAVESALLAFNDLDPERADAALARLEHALEKAIEQVIGKDDLLAADAFRAAAIDAIEVGLAAFDERAAESLRSRH